MNSYTEPTNHQEALEAAHQATNYDLLNATTPNTTLQDTESIRTTKAIIPTTFIDAKNQLNGLWLLW